MLRSSDLARMQTTADVYENLALAGKVSRRRVGEALGVRDAHVDLSVAIELGVVLRGRDDRRGPRPPGVFFPESYVHRRTEIDTYGYEDRVLAFPPCNHVPEIPRL